MVGPDALVVRAAAKIINPSGSAGAGTVEIPALGKMVSAHCLRYHIADPSGIHFYLIRKDVGSMKRIPLEQQYPEDIESRGSFAGFVAGILFWNCGTGAAKVLGLILAVVYSVSLIWMPWRLERRLKKLTHPDLQAKERMGQLRREKWWLPGLALIYLCIGIAAPLL